MRKSDPRYWNRRRARHREAKLRAEVHELREELNDARGAILWAIDFLNRQPRGSKWEIALEHLTGFKIDTRKAGFSDRIGDGEVLPELLVDVEEDGSGWSERHKKKKVTQ